MDKKYFLEIRHFAEQISQRAGQILLDFREKAQVKSRKNDYLDIATSADLASEEYLLSEIGKKFPDHDFVSEEAGEKKCGSDFTWFIDPLDGTKEYIRRTPIFNVSLTVEYKNKIVVGTVFHPVTGELYSSSLGNGSFLNGRQIKVSREKKIANSIVWIHLPHFGDSQEKINLTWKTARQLAQEFYRLRSFQADVTVLCYLALGALEGFVMTVSGPKWWDVAPGILMVEEAGGKITDTKGNKIKNRDLSSGLIASNGEIHSRLLKIVNA